MERMGKADFLAAVAKNEGAAWLGGEALSRELALHLPAQDTVVGWLWLERRKVGPEKYESATLALLTECHFVLVEAVERLDCKSTAISVESAPLGRLRYVRTDCDHTGAGGFTLDFAGPVFERSTGGLAPPSSQISFRQEKGWPGDEVTAFLSAIASVRK